MSTPDVPVTQAPASATEVVTTPEATVTQETTEAIDIVEGTTVSAQSMPVQEDGPVEEAIRVTTADIRPADIPPGLLPGTAADGLATAPPPPLPTEEEIMNQYRIGAMDVLQFKSFDDTTLDTVVTVRHDGYVSLPWIADVKVAGLTRDEATAAIREAYKELYFEAEVSVQITEAMSKSYTVVGDVNRPSEIPYRKPITLLDAIVAAGSLRVNQRGGDSFVGGQGQLVKAYIIRGEGEQRTSTPYDLRNLERAGLHETQAPVLPGDTVFIPEGLNLVYVLGAVGRPGIQPLPDGMTLLQLLASVNGVNESVGRMKQIVLMREINETQTEIKLIDLKKILKMGGDILMQPGDTVYVPRKRLVTLGEFISRSTQLVSPIIGITSQTMGLYTQAFDAYYADDRADLLYNSNNSSQIQTNLQLLEAIRQIGTVADTINGTN